MPKDKLQTRAFYDPKTKLAVGSTDVLDRQDEIIDQTGWELDNFKKNNPLLWAHNSYEPLIGNCKNVRVEKMMGKNALVFEPDFHEETELAKAVKTLFEQGRLKTFSVGFKPLEMDGNKYIKQELLEISAVNIPANPEAQMLAYRSLSDAGFKKSVINEVLQKGAVADELANPDDWKVKNDNMRDVFDIFYAMCDVYFDEATPTDNFGVLLKECASLFGKVASGNYTKPDSTKTLFAVLDKDSKSDNDKGNQAKVPSTASKYHQERISMLKVISRASEVLNKEGKLPKQNHHKLIKVINRASDIVIEQHKGELKNG